ncbi:MAG: hypothetical protein J5496_06845 [Lachnospiraceae bacterium]|nr:hypothetical protein [Lachnospiraceae bacterium]
MKRILAGLFALTLLLAACGQAGKQTEVPAGPDGTEQAAGTKEQKVLGLSALSESQQAVYMDAGNAYNTLVQYVTGPASSERLKECFAGMRQTTITEWISDTDSELLTIYLSDPEDPECLAELASLGLGTKYKVEKGVGTRMYLGQCAEEIKEKLAALKAKETLTEEEKTLIQRYNPRNIQVYWSMGQVWIEVSIKTPWYSTGENWSEADMYQDLERCKELFRELIDDNEVVCFTYGV